MALIAELIDAGVQMKRAGNLQGAIEHFRQLQATYPGNARIMFELANAWSSFTVPQRALPLYQELLALPPGQGLPPKDMPRLYSRLGATLLDLGDSQQALTTLEAGLGLHPSYRPLRFWRICALSRSGADRLALLDALELLLASLAPSRWDVFEGDIQAAVHSMRAEWAGEATQPPLANKPPNSQTLESSRKVHSADEAPATIEKATGHDAKSAEADAESDSIPVVVKPAARQTRNPGQRPQLGKRAVRIDISADVDTPKDKPSDEDGPSGSPSAFKIPLEPD